MTFRRWVPVAAILVLSLERPVSAQLAFYVNDHAGFTSTVASFTNAGTETFEESTLAASQITSFTDPLAPGVANPPFASGTASGPGVTVQANTLAGNPTNVSPRLTSAALATASAGYFGTPTDQVSTNSAPDSFDILFAPANGQFVRAVGLLPLFFVNGATGPTSNPGTVTIKVYGADKTTLLGTQSMSAVDYSGTSFLGIVALGSNVIGRVNIWAGNNTSFFAGADDISVFTSPTAPVALISFGAE